MNEDRKRIQPFIDWLIDNRIMPKETTLFSDMEDYLKELDQGQSLPIDSVRLSFTSIDKAVNDLNLNKRVKWFVWNGELVRKGSMCPEPVIVNGYPVLINEYKH
jgi:hypothetical protein